VSISTAVAIVLAALSTTITSLAYLREHDAAAALPVLSMRRPLHSLRLLLSDRSWLVGFALGPAWLGLVATAAALAAAFLNAAFGYCLGCEMYLLVRRVTVRTE